MSFLPSSGRARAIGLDAAAAIRSLRGPVSPCLRKAMVTEVGYRPVEIIGHSAKRVNIGQKEKQARLRDAKVSTGLKKNLTTSYVRPKGKSSRVWLTLPGREAT